MKYFSISTVESAYKNISARTNNKFWGILAITSSVNSIVAPQRVYTLDVDNVSNLLEKQFCLVENPKVYSRGAQWNVIFSKNWAEYISQKLLKYSPNIYDVLVWYFRREVFEDDITKQQLVAIFLEETNISTEFAKQLFAFDDRQLEYSSDKYSESKLLASLNEICNNSTTYTTITAEKSFVAASAGELSRAPFVQTLYAGQGAQECMILTQFDFNEYYGNIVSKKSVSLVDNEQGRDILNDAYVQILTALRTKPFLLLAGISGTGKSRIAREIAKACWPLDSEQRKKQVPDNFCMVQVKPNWHDSTELLGYVSRINGEKYVVGDFTKFVAKAAQNPEIPYILCLDEMNLAPVEQYFAEYLSVVESRKAHADGSITTDPLIDFELTDAYITLINQLIKDENERQEYLKEKDGKRLTIPQNLFVIGTVNMDETTFSFSRKVLDRAMTIEMNEVNLYGGLEESSKGDLGYIGNVIIGHAAEGKDVYVENKALCDQVIEYLEEVNKVLEGTPFKIAYRTRNEFLLYAVNRQVIDPKSQVWQTLDEMTSMKILSRIEGDSERTKQPLEKLKDLVNRIIVGEQNNESISGAKIEEMLDKLQKTGYTSYWT